jgi:hypothetical protein
VSRAGCGFGVRPGLVRPGVAAEETFATLLEAELLKQDFEVEVVNAGVGGERTDQALKRLDQAVLALKPRFVLVVYGTLTSAASRQRRPRWAGSASRATGAAG